MQDAHHLEGRWRSRLAAPWKEAGWPLAHGRSAPGSTARLRKYCNIPGSPAKGACTSEYSGSSWPVIDEFFISPFVRHEILTPQDKCAVSLLDIPNSGKGSDSRVAVGPGKQKPGCVVKGEPAINFGFLKKQCLFHGSSWDRKILQRRFLQGCALTEGGFL